MTTHDIENLNLSTNVINSRMLLLKTNSPKTTLEIVPITHSNLFRFINSVGPRTKSK